MHVIIRFTGFISHMRVFNFLVLAFAAIKAEDSDDHEGKGGISFSISKTSTKGPVEHADDVSEEVHEKSSSTESVKSHSAPEDTKQGQEPRQSDTSDVATDTSTNSTESTQLVDDASTRSLGIAHQTDVFFHNLQNVSLTISELGLEGTNAAIHIRTLASYTELLMKSLEHLESLQPEEKRIYWDLKDTVNVSGPSPVLLFACRSSPNM